MWILVNLFFVALNLVFALHPENNISALNWFACGFASMGAIGLIILETRP